MKITLYANMFSRVICEYATINMYLFVILRHIYFCRTGSITARIASSSALISTQFSAILTKFTGKFPCNVTSASSRLVINNR